MIAAVLPPSVVAAGNLVARTETWAITTDTIEKAIFPTLPNGETIKVKHITRIVTCHHLPTSKQVVFSRKKKHWYDSRKVPVLRRRGLFAAPEQENDWRGATVAQHEVISEVARMGGGERSRAIIAAALLG